VRRIACEAGAEDAITADNWSEGGAGAEALAQAVLHACSKPNNFHFLYPVEASIKYKIECIVRELYGGAAVEYSPEAEQKIKIYTRQGFDKLPVCMAKTQYSLSHDPELKGVPTGFIVPIMDVHVSAGSGFVYPLLGKMSTMPGLSSRPNFYEIDIDTQTGRVIGLS
jgi:formyltetrahydrofolate synthetase